jgi:hypothetical protein
VGTAIRRPQMLDPAQKAVRQTRDHVRGHGDQEGCAECDLWHAYNDHPEMFDAIIARIESDELRARAEAMRAFGEGTWTDRESE